VTEPDEGERLGEFLFYVFVGGFGPPIVAMAIDKWWPCLLMIVTVPVVLWLARSW
jgi:hypothetical protein